MFKETENIYNEDFQERQSFIVFALDSIDARIYIDTKLNMFKKCGIDSGTSGIEGHSQIIVPQKTDTYVDEVPSSKIKKITNVYSEIIPF